MVSIYPQDLIMKIRNPEQTELAEFVALRSQADSKSALNNLLLRLEARKTRIEDLWVLTNESDNILAAFSVSRIPGTDPLKVVAPRTVENLGDEAALFLLGWLAEQQGGSRLSLNLSSKRNDRNLVRLACQNGWVEESHVLVYVTDLTGMNGFDEPEFTRPFSIEEMLDERFVRFYSLVTNMADSGQVRSILEAKTQHYTTYQAVEGYKVVDATGQLLAAGLVGRQREGVARIELLGVIPPLRGQGWGARLHQYLMHKARRFAPQYVGATDYGNYPMRRIFELNGCTFSEEQWTLVRTHQ